tara:strand:+ start:72 stop:998 length:927 start_codon:yes stop_codon:yes gene_type:complete
MRKKIFFLILIPFLSFSEIINFKNGDKISGTIVDSTNDLIVLNNEFIGIIKIPSNQIKKEIITKKKKTPWSGQVSASVLTRDSNTLQKKYDDTVTEKSQLIDDVKLQVQTSYKKESYEFKWTSKYRFYRTDILGNIRIIDDLFNISQEYKYLFSEKSYYFFSRSLYQQDYRRAIDHEFLQTAEIGLDIIKKRNMTLSTSIGIAYHRYLRTIVNSTNAENIDRDVELPKGVFTENFRWEIIDDLALIQQYKHQGDFSNYQFSFKAGVENKMISNLFLKLEYKIEEDTEVSYDDKGYYNRSLLASIVYKF